MAFNEVKTVRFYKVFPVETDKIFKLSTYTKGIQWKNHKVEGGLRKLNLGKRCFGWESEIIRLSYDEYIAYLYIYIQKLKELPKFDYVSNTPNNQWLNIVNEANISYVRLFFNLRGMDNVTFKVWLNGTIIEDVFLGNTSGFSYTKYFNDENVNMSILFTYNQSQWINNIMTCQRFIGNVTKEKTTGMLNIKAYEI